MDGDSASSTELYAILSSLAEIPIEQGIAVTGSVNQNGEIQAIGGINHKIEGFFDVCRLKGFTGDQGVLMPRANLRNLMLRTDVVSAVTEEKFHIHAVSTIDEGIEVLTGIAAGERDHEGRYPEGSVNDRVQKKLQQYVEQQKRLAPGNPGAAPSTEEN
ncbi:MAG: S16 family serine protease [Candidatus Binatia bacterium]|nr:S16 family serine protease [Candidatus Binatia bacterium]